MSSIYQENEKNKSPEFRANEKLDRVIAELKALLQPVQKQQEKRFESNRYPLILIAGAPRSGTTLFLQWLDALDKFSCPTNFLNRFAYAPYIGALIQKMLFDPDYDFHGEFAGLQKSANFSSRLGKSQGTLAISEFQHFFRNYMPNFDPEYLQPEKLAQVDFAGIRRGLAGIESVFDQPFACKIFMLQFHIRELYRHLPHVLIIHIKRDPLQTMLSVLKARERYYGGRDIWWSVKPREYARLKDEDWYHQIAGQLYYTQSSIEKELEALPASGVLQIHYEDLCRDPQRVYRLLADKLQILGYALGETYKGPGSFEVRQASDAADKDVQALTAAYREIEKRKERR